MKKAVAVCLGVGLAGSLAMAGPWAVGVGGSFLATAPILDLSVSYQVVPNFLASQFTVAVASAGLTSTSLIVTSSLLFTPTIGSAGVSFYVGAGFGAAVTVGGGVAQGQLATEALGGLRVHLNPSGGIYLQGKFVGTIAGGSVSGAVMPGFGLFLRF